MLQDLADERRRGVEDHQRLLERYKVALEGGHRRTSHLSMHERTASGIMRQHGMLKA